MASTTWVVVQQREGSLHKMSITLGQHPALQARLKGRLYSAHALVVAKPELNPPLGTAPALVAG